MPAKVCPRCGSQYDNFHSKTCPQCFAILVTVDEETAEELSAARAEVVRSPEFQEAKAVDDERFREQSFGACLGIAALTLATVVLVIVLLVSAAHHHSVRNPSASSPKLQAAKDEPLTTLPVAAATLDEVLPSAIAPYQRQSSDSAIVLTGTLTPLFHGVYVRGPLTPNNGGTGKEEKKGAASSTPTGQSPTPTPPLLGAGGPLDVYALPAERPTPEQNEFRLGITLAGQAGGVSRPTLFFATEYWHFAVLAAPGDAGAPAAFRDALAAHFGYTIGSKVEVK
ncbi:MAG: hypothetical protein ACRYFS_15605 [Janthinobacterium lividum]